MKYSELTRQYFAEPPCVGMFDGPASVRGEAGSRAHGAWVQFDLQLDGAGVLIQAARFLAFGCPYLIAVSAWVAEHAEGAAIGAPLPESIAALQGRFTVPVEKLGRLLTVEDAWAAAMHAAGVHQAH